MKPEILQSMSQILILIGIIITGLGGFGSYYFGKTADKAKESANTEREESLESKINELLQGNESLKSRLIPFEDLAKRIHPSLETEVALKKLREDVETLERKSSPRQLAEDQSESLAKKLREYSPKTIELKALLGDNEAFQFASDLKKAIEKGGWAVGEIQQIIFSIPISGLVISVGKDDPPPDECNELFNALRAAGLKATGNLDPNKKGKIALLVGTKA